MRIHPAARTKAGIVAATIGLSLLMPMPSCGSDPTEQAGSVGDPPPQAGQSPRWSEVQRQSVCTPDGPTCITGEIRVDSQQRYTIVNTSSTGLLSENQWMLLEEAAREALSQDLSGPPQCESIVTIPEIGGTQLVLLVENPDTRTQSPVTLLEFVGNTSLRCHRGDLYIAQRLDSVMNDLMLRYAPAGSSLDPCTGVDLPPCPPSCPTGWQNTCGQPCVNPGETCGNNIGDGRVCSPDRIYLCTIHPPQTPGQCNQVCR